MPDLQSLASSAAQVAADAMTVGETMKAGVDIPQSNYWLTAGAVVLYSARALYTNFRNMSLGKMSSDTAGLGKGEEF